MGRKATFSLCLIALFGILAWESEATGASSLREQMITKAKQEGQLVAAGQQVDFFRNKLKGFHKKYPFLRVKAFKADTSGTLNRTLAEARAGKVSMDLIAVANDGQQHLVEAGVLQKYEFPHFRDFVAGHQPAHGLYVNAFVSPDMQGAYNTDMVPRKDVPKSWDEMTDPKWTGKTMLSRSQEDMPARLAWLWRENGKLNWDRSFDFFSKLGKHNPLITRGHRGGVKRLAAGEVAIFWFAALGPTSRTAFNGAPIGLISFPTNTNRYRAYGILKGAPHPAAAWLLVDYLMSPEGQFEYTNIVGARLLLNKKAKPGGMARWLVEQGVRLENFVPLDVTALDTKKVKKSERFFFELLGIR